MTIAITAFDAAKYFTTPEAQAQLLSDALREGDAAYIAAVIGVVAKARGIASIAEETGLSRQALHRALSARGNPTLATLLKVTRVLGIELVAKAREPAEA